MINQLKTRIGLYSPFIFLFLFFSCQHPLEDLSSEDRFGTVRLACKVSRDVIRYDGGRTAEVSTDDFIVKFLTAGGDVYKSYERFADIGTGVALEPGTYYVAVQSGEAPVAAFDNPWYYGESDVFSIDYEETKTVEVMASLGTCRVSVTYSESVTTRFSGWSTTISSASGTLDFVGDEQRHGYFPIGALDIVSTLTYLQADQTEAVKTLTGRIADPLPQYHYDIVVEAFLDSGVSALNILVDETLTHASVTIGNAPEVVEGPVSQGDLLITEIMYNPAALSDTEGEWFEIRNMTNADIDLHQLVIREGLDVLHIIGDQIVLGPGAYFVLGRTLTATSSVSYVYGSDLTLTNTGQEIILANYGDDGTNGSVICSVNYGLTGFPDGHGASISLDPTITDVHAAADGAGWCLSTSVFDTGDLGTPGEVNDACL